MKTFFRAFLLVVAFLAGPSFAACEYVAATASSSYPTVNRYATAALACNAEALSKNSSGNTYTVMWTTATTCAMRRFQSTPGVSSTVLAPIFHTCEVLALAGEGGGSTDSPGLTSEKVADHMALFSLFLGALAVIFVGRWVFNFFRPQRYES